MRLAIGLLPLAFALPCAAYTDAPPRPAPQVRALYLNQWGGITPCRLARSDEERAYCAGAEDEARDPARFNCAERDTIEEVRFCAGRRKR